MTVDIVEASGRLLLTIRDEGIGMSQSELQQLFKPFTRTDGGAAMAAGTGLGLVSARHIIEAHGGKPRLSSEVGCGCTVSVELPHCHS